MTTYTPLSDATLAQDKPLTQSISRALRDNPIAITEGASGAPRNVPASLDFPYFFASRSTGQNFLGAGGAGSKVQCNTEVYDPDNLYDNATNYRFTPNRAGVYRISGYADVTAAGGSITTISLWAMKNGSTYLGTALSNALPATGKGPVQFETIVQMNGTTDYVEMFVDSTNSGTNTLNLARFIGHAICEI